MRIETPYNPLDKTHLGESVAEALLAKNYEPMSNIEPFIGAGIYAIYYDGPFAPYQRLRIKGDAVPIYVGKAVPPGARKGSFGLNADPGQSLFKRLREHGESIKQAENLDIDDFRCRFLVVDDIWIPLGESLVIAKYSPIWNKIIDGFGNHDPGKGRYNQMRSRWDTLHPGRAWALKCQERTETSGQIQVELEEFIREMFNN